MDRGSIHITRRDASRPTCEQAGNRTNDRQQSVDRGEADRAALVKTNHVQRERATPASHLRFRLLTVPAGADDLKRNMLDREPRQGSFREQGRMLVLELGNAPAVAADRESRTMLPMSAAASDVGVQSFDPVGKPALPELPQRPIDLDRRSYWGRLQRRENGMST
jgi:hypothetical protein